MGLFFKTCFCSGAETEIKWRTDIEKQHNICIFSYVECWCLIPFSSDVFYDRKNNVRLFCDYSEKGRQIRNS